MILKTLGRVMSKITEIHNDFENVGPYQPKKTPPPPQKKEKKR